MSLDDLDDRTRRAILKGAAGALGLAAVGSAGGHPNRGEHPKEDGEHEAHDHASTMNADLVGFHTLGDVGSESVSGGPDNPLYGMITDVWLEGDLGFVAMQSTSEPTGNRGVAILDVSAYTRAESRAELETAEMTVLSYIGNESEAGTANDVKVSDDGQYLAYSKQAFGWDYGNAASASTEDQDEPGPNVTGAEVYDISDPGDPEYVGSAQGPNPGFHNCFVHQIGGDHYVFGVQGVGPGSAGVHVYRIRERGVEPVNFWGGEEIRDGAYDQPAQGPIAGGYYCHDFYVHEDPKTGRPLGFVAYWNYGVRVLDMSDPEDITELGFGPMRAAHYAQPAPALIDGKRVFVGGQEHEVRSEAPSGYVVLFDGEDLFEDGLTECPELARWTLYENVSYGGYAYSPHNNDIVVEDDGDAWITQANYHAGVLFLKIEPPGEGEVNTGEWHLAGRRYGDGNEETFVELDAGEQFSGLIGPGAAGSTSASHRFVPGEDDGEGEADLIEANLSTIRNVQDNDLYLEVNTSGDPENPEWERVTRGYTFNSLEYLRGPVEIGTLHRLRVETFANVLTRYEIEATYIENRGDPDSEPFQRTVEEEGLAFYRDHVEVPDESMTDDRMTPDFWSARSLNGVTFGCSQHSGLYAIAADPIAVGTRTAADVSVTRNSDGRLFTGGQTNRLEYEVETDETVRLRDRLPSSWAVVGGDAHTAYDTGDGRRVEFDESVEPTGAGSATRTLFVTVSGMEGPQVGPVEYSPDGEPSKGGKDWESVAGTVASSLVGPSQP